MSCVRYALILLALALLAVPALAADEVVMMPLSNALSMPESQQKPDGAVKFYFATRPTARIIRSFGPFVVNPKTNAFAKGTGTACEWVFLSALRSLQEQAESVGANAVVDIVSYYKKHIVSSQTAYECHKGFLIAGVALRGELVRLADR